MRNLLLTCLLAVSAVAFAQTRYIDQLFPVDVQDLRPYGANFSYLTSILSGGQVPPSIDTLRYRTFLPQGDTETNRPVIIISHTGSYMPIPLNGGLTGGINDQAVLEIAGNFASRGYVVVTPENRVGWASTLPDVELQTSTLLLASLRGAQDMHMMRRYLSHTVANEGNFLGIDSSRVMILGLGTGGYNALNSNFLDNVQEVNDLNKFISPTTGNFYYNPDVEGDVYGVEAGATNNPQWTNHANGWSFVVNAGGALGDSSWIDGKSIEAPVIALQSTEDLNAPYGIESIQVPTTMNTVLQNGAGGRIIVEAMNANGGNAILDTTNARLLAENEDLTVRVEALSDVNFVTPIQGFSTTVSTENFYPFQEAFGTGFANRYNWADTALLSAPIRAFIAANNFPLTFEQLVAREQASNPNFLDANAARAYQDTLVRFTLPRAYAAMELGDLMSSSVELTPEEAGFEISPNPANTYAILEVRDDLLIDRVQVYNTTGQIVLDQPVVGTSRHSIDVSLLSSGFHYVLIQTNEGRTIGKLQVR